MLEMPLAVLPFVVVTPDWEYENEMFGPIDARPTAVAVVLELPVWTLN
jgi:hypothetical protein